MSLKQFEYILAVAELKSFGQAADKCCITQSTLSTMVGRFESEIGIQIFDRKTKPVTITKEGATLIQQLKIVDKEIGQLDELIQSMKGELSGELKIGIIPTVAPFILPELLNDFTKKFPDIQFSVSEMTTETITDLLIKRELDIGILAIPLEQDFLIEIPLYNEPFVLYDCSKENIEEYASLEDIDFDKFWLLSEGHCLHTQVKRICDFDRYKNKKEVNFDFKTGSIESLIRFVKINKGITILPYLASLGFLPKDQERIAYFKAPLPVRTIGLVIHQHFIKRQILNLLQIEIQERIVPLLNANSKEYVIAPV